MSTIHHASSWIQFYLLLFVIYGLGLKLTTATTDDLEELGRQAWRDALHEARMTVDDCASDMQQSASLTYQQLRGEKPLPSLSRFLRVRPTFWVSFGPTLIWLAAKRSAKAIFSVE